jgi:replicative DNA helicase
VSEPIMPRCVDAEECLLAGLLVQPNLMDEAQGSSLGRKDFYVERYGILFDTMRALHQRHGTFDEVSIKDYLVESGRWERFGGVLTLDKVLSKAANTRHFNRYCELVIEKSLKRAIIDAGEQVVRLGYTDLPGTEALDQSEEALRSLHKRGNSGDAVASYDGVAEHIRKVIGIQEGTLVDEFIPSGIAVLDRMIGGGFRPGWQVVVMSASGHGKSALAVNNFALSAAGAGHPVLICSYEMSATEVYGRLVGALSGVSVQDQAQPGLDPMALSRVHGAADQVCAMPIEVEGPSCGSIPAIRRSARRLAVQHSKPMVIVVDYLQLMRGGSSRRDASQSDGLSANSRGLKLLAVELGCVVIMLSQPTLEAKRTKKRPHISDSKGSGSIEDDADLTLVPWLPHRVGAGSPSHAEIGVDKFRHGLYRHITRDEVTWVGRKMQFSDANSYASSEL